MNRESRYRGWDEEKKVWGIWIWECEGFKKEKENDRWEGD